MEKAEKIYKGWDIPPMNGENDVEITPRFVTDRKSYKDFLGYIETYENHITYNSLVDVAFFDSKKYNARLTKDLNILGLTPIDTGIPDRNYGILGKKTIKIYHQPRGYKSFDKVRYPLHKINFSTAARKMKWSLINFYKINPTVSIEEGQEVAYSMASLLASRRAIVLKESIIESVNRAAYEEVEKLKEKYHPKDEFDFIDKLDEWSTHKWLIPTGYMKSGGDLDQFTVLEVINLAKSNMYKDEALKKEHEINEIIDALISAGMFVSKETIMDHYMEPIGIKALTNILSVRKEAIAKHNERLFGTRRYSKYNRELQES